MAVRILIGDCRDKLRELPDGSVNCCVTSPPYFGLRDYGVDGQMGLEPTPDEFVAGMVEVFREVRRVLRDDGTLWLNIGDTYNNNPSTSDIPRAEQGNGSGAFQIPPEKHVQANRAKANKAQPLIERGIKKKDLIGIPWLLAFALRADGWYLRQDIIWSKPNPMPESVRDRCTKAHEYLFLLSKGPRYYYDAEAIAEPISMASVARLLQNVEAQAGSERVPGKTNGPMKAVSRASGNKERKPGSARGCPEGSSSNVCGSVPWEGSTRNKRSVWEVPTQPFSEAHFATFPPALIEPCILAGCPTECCSDCGAPWERIIQATAPDGRKAILKRETIGMAPSCSCDAPKARGTVLDPFFGAGTTGLVADRLGRDCIGIELNPEYATIAERRLNADAPLFAEVKAA